MMPLPGDTTFDYGDRFFFSSSPPPQWREGGKGSGLVGVDDHY